MTIAQMLRSFIDGMTRVFGITGTPTKTQRHSRSVDDQVRHALAQIADASRIHR